MRIWIYIIVIIFSIYILPSIINHVILATSNKNLSETPLVNGEE